MKKLALLLLLFLPINLFSQNFSFSGEFDTYHGIYMPYTDNKGNNSNGILNYIWKIDSYSDNDAIYIEGQCLYDYLTKTFETSLNEAYMDYSYKNLGIRLGKQKIIWGKADGINIINSVFPEDSTSLFINDSSIAISGLKLSYNTSKIVTELIYIPFITESKLPLDPTNQLYSILIPKNTTMFLQGQNIVLPVSIDSIKKPEMQIKNAEYGIKLSGYFSFFDISLYGFYGYEKKPLFNYYLNTNGISPEILITGEYKKLLMFGLDSAIPIKNIVFRIETAFFPDRKKQCSKETILCERRYNISKNELSSLIGIDWIHNDFTFTSQYYLDYIFGTTSKLDNSQNYNHGITLNISQSLLNQTLELSCSGIISFNNFENVIKPEVSYSLTDSMKLSLIGYFFNKGNNNNISYGQFYDLSSIQVMFSYCF